MVLSKQHSRSGGGQAAPLLPPSLLLTMRRRRPQSRRAATSGCCRAARKTSAREPRLQYSVTTQGGMGHTPRKPTTLGCLRSAGVSMQGIGQTGVQCTKPGRFEQRWAVELAGSCGLLLLMASLRGAPAHLRAAIRPASCEQRVNNRGKLWEGI